MMHGQTDDLVGHLGGNGEVFGGGTGEATIGAEGTDEGIEVATAFIH